MLQSDVLIQSSLYVNLAPKLSFNFLSFSLNLLSIGLLFSQINTINIMTELLILEPQFLHNNLVSPPDRLGLKELIHSLKRNTLGLRNAEEDEEDRSDHKRGKEDIHSESPGVEHLLGETGDDEVPEPVVGSGVGLAERAGVLVEHLRVENPGCTVPRRCVESGPEVEEEDSCDTTGGKGGALSSSDLGFVVGDLDVSTDEVHAESTATSTNHEKVSATDVIDKNENPDKGNSRLDNAKDTSGKEASVGTGDTDTSEDSGAIVVDGVDTGACKMLVIEMKA
jgi:hypothetical protein